MVSHELRPRHERLEAWVSAHRLALLLYRLTHKMPAHERYGLTQQIRRAAVSVCSNLVEGAARPGVREFRRFVNISYSSLCELRYQLRLCEDLCYLSHSDLSQGLELAEQTSRLIWGLYRSLGGVRSPNARTSERLNALTTPLSCPESCE